MLNIVYPYYTNKSLLTDQLERWNEYSDFVKSNINIIIVDDGSPHSEAHSIVKKYNYELSITVLRIHEDILWNTAGARNVGVHYVSEHVGEDAIVFLSLMDAILPEESVSLLLKNIDRLDFKNTVYTFKRKDIFTNKEYRYHDSLLILTPAIYHSVGGFDEDFSVAYGYDDTLFKFVIDKHTPHAFKILDCYVHQYHQGDGNMFNYEYDFAINGDHRVQQTRNLNIYNNKIQQSLEQLMTSQKLRFNWSVVS